MTRSFQAVLFDLFGTVVHFAIRPPRESAPADERPVALGWLAEILTAELPEVSFADFLRALGEVSSEIHRGRAPEYLEVPSVERFRRSLERLGIEERRAREGGRRLSVVHMRHLASQTLLPEHHVAVLGQIRRRYRMALVSNFDDEATAREVLEAHGVRRYFDPVVVSAGHGRRKPHPSIFLDTLRSMGVEAEQAVFVGDNPAEDVAGARAAGLAVVWINAEGRAYPVGLPAPSVEIRDLAELPAALERA